MSTDCTIDIVEKYSKHIEKIVSEKDNGLFDAMNKGIEISSGDIIGIINSDDYYNLDTVTTIVEKYRKYGNGCIYHGNLILLDKQGRVNKLLKTNIDSMFFMRSGCTIAHPTVFIPKEMYKKYGDFDLTYWLASDYDLLLRFIRKYKSKCIYIDEYLSYFSTDGQSSDVIKAVYDSHLVRLNNNLNFFESYFYLVRSIVYYYLMVVSRFFKKTD
jgi:glycosyltransferase involved in cell wall biosynthesis